MHRNRNRNRNEAGIKHEEFERILHRARSRRAAFLGEAFGALARAFTG